jgi:hypothetical protein
VNQSLATNQAPLDQETESVLALKEKELMSRLAVVTYEPELSGTPAVPLEPLLDPTNVEFDDALARVADSYFERQSRPIRMGSTEQEESCESSPSSAISALVGTGVIAAAGYRLVLRPPDDPKLRPSWYSRFPTR